MKKLRLTNLLVGMVSFHNNLKEDLVQGVKEQWTFPYTITEEAKKRKFSAAMDRSFNHYSATHPCNNELYSQYEYIGSKGLDDKNSDVTISGRDPSKVVFENGKCRVWPTKQDTIIIPVETQNANQGNNTIPYKDWGLSEIWYVDSEEGFAGKEQGAAAPCIPQGFTNIFDGRGFTWGLRYFVNAGTPQKGYSIIARFDCDLS